jgi:hypothetical protein
VAFALLPYLPLYREPMYYVLPLFYNRVQRIFFLKKIKNTDPLMGAKFKSKTHLHNTFFYFWRCFLRVWIQSLKKVLTRPKKMRYFMLILNALKKFCKNAPK